MTSATFLILIGRVILGLFFVIAGLRNGLAFTERTTLATNYNWKLPAPVMATGFAIQFFGGLSVALGVYPAWGAALLILFLISATLIYHNFILFEGEARLPHLYFTLVNVALCGYCLMVIGLSLGA